MTFDILLHGGTLYDGSGRHGERGDIAIAEGHIAAIGKVSGRAQRAVDVWDSPSRRALSISRPIPISRCRSIQRRKARFDKA